MLIDPHLRIMEGIIAYITFLQAKPDYNYQKEKITIRNT